MSKHIASFCIGAGTCYGLVRLWSSDLLSLNNSELKKHDKTPEYSPFQSTTTSDGVSQTTFVDKVHEHYPMLPLPSSDNILRKDSLVTSVNYRNRFPNWVAEKLTIESVSAPSCRVPFIVDPSVPKLFNATNEDYWNSGYSRGHMAAAGHHKLNESHQKSTFMLSGNILPQELSNNGGEWYELEIFSRRLLDIFDDVYVLNGPLFLPHALEDKSLLNHYEPPTSKMTINSIGDQIIPAPTHLFKIISVGKRREMDGEGGYLSAFIVTNEPMGLKGPVSIMEVPLSSLAWLSGLNFEGMILPLVAGRRNISIDSLYAKVLEGDNEAIETFKTLKNEAHDIYNSMLENTPRPSKDFSKRSNVSLPPDWISSPSATWAGHLIPLGASKEQDWGLCKKTKYCGESASDWVQARVNEWKTLGSLSRAQSIEDLESIWSRIPEKTQKFNSYYKEYYRAKVRITLKDNGVTSAEEVAKLCIQTEKENAEKEAAAKALLKQQQLEKEKLTVSSNN